MNKPTWTATTRTQHMREGLRFASDVTDNEWAVLAQTGARLRSPPRRLTRDDPRRHGKPASPSMNNSQTDSHRLTNLSLETYSPFNLSAFEKKDDNVC